MKIKLEKDADGYRADCLDLPGSPPVGRGSTEVEAMANLTFILLFGNMASPTRGAFRRWGDCIPEEELITIERTYTAGDTSPAIRTDTRR